MSESATLLNCLKEGGIYFCYLALTSYSTWNASLFIFHLSLSTAQSINKSFNQKLYSCNIKEPKVEHGKPPSQPHVMSPHLKLRWKQWQLHWCIQVFTSTPKSNVTLWEFQLSAKSRLHFAHVHYAFSQMDLRAFEDKNNNNGGLQSCWCCWLC